jgi:N4-gp56 family major capsid protein
MDFNLSEFSNSVAQPIGDPDIEKIVVDGEEMKAYVFKDKILMSPGIWNQWYYSPEELQKAYGSTDWTDASNLALFADHKDQDTSAWVGYVRNPRLMGEHQLGDLVLVDKDYAKKLMLGAKFGVSPKFEGTGTGGAAKNLTYKNFSVVVNPACKTTFLNQEEKDASIKDEAAAQESVANEDKSNTMDAKETKAEEKVEEKLELKEEAKPTEIKEELKSEEVAAPPVEQKDNSTELISKLSDTISLSFGKMTEKLEELEKQRMEQLTAKEEEPVEKVCEKELPQPEGEPIRQTLKDSEVASDEVMKFANVDSGMASYLKQLGKGSESFELAMEEDDESKLPWMSFTLASTATAVTSVRGDSRTAYNLLPTKWAKEVIDGGKNLLFFTNVVRQAVVPKGTNDYIMPIREKYEDTWESSSEEYAIDTNIAATVLNDMNGIQFTPVRYNYRVGITNKAVNTNAIDLMRYSREELSYKWANDVDVAVATGLNAATNAAAGAPGAMDLYGGSATATNTLADGDVLSTDLIAEGKKLLRSKWNYYWTGGVLTKDSDLKNPWENTPDSPYVLFIAPEQEEILLTDSQFVNAAEYGGGEIVLNGEIGKYLGVKVVVSNNTPAYANFGIGGNIDGHKCLLVKSQYCGGLAWGEKPGIKAFDWPIEDKKMIVMNLEYHSRALQNDAVVRINVVD